MPKRKRTGGRKRKRVYASKRRLSKWKRQRKSKSRRAVTSVGVASVARRTNRLSNKRYGPSSSGLAKLLNKRGRPYTPKLAIASATSYQGHMKVKMRYPLAGVLRPTGGALPQVLFEIGMNNLFDPNETGLGAQPYGFDEFMALYEKYIVTSSKVTYYITNRSVSASKIRVWVAPIQDNTMSVTDTWREARVTPKVKTMILAESTSGTDNDIGAISLNYTPQAHVNLGGIGAVENSIFTSFVGISTADVPNKVIAKLFVERADGVSLADDSIYVEAMVEYQVSFFEPKVIGLS